VAPARLAADPDLADRAAAVAADHPDVGGPVVVACSGGADSLALLLVAATAGWQPTAVHVDHGLRPGSAAEGERVAVAAARLGCAARTVTVAVAPGPNLEARARDARYDALSAAADELGARWVLTGHTMDDQAETVLLNLLRGAATTGLGGIPTRRGAVVRPLLGWRRSATLELCARAGLDPVDDPMNADTRFRRVVVRREVLPALAAAADRDVVPVLARQAELVRADDEYLDEVAAAALAALGPRPAAGRLAALAPPIARRVVRRWLGEPPPAAADVAAVLEVAAARRRAVELTGRRRVERAGGVLILTEAPEASDDTGLAGPGPPPVTGAVPGRLERAGWVVETWVERAPPLTWPSGRWEAVVDADAVGSEVVLRSSRPGERVRPLGLDGTKLVTDALAESGVAAAARPAHPVVARAGDDEIVWVLGYRVADAVRVTTATRRYLWMEARCP
jgi:tRNA(Ile)-lysidine synthase